MRDPTYKFKSIFSKLTIVGLLVNLITSTLVQYGLHVLENFSNSINKRNGD